MRTFKEEKANKNNKSFLAGGTDAGLFAGNTGNALWVDTLVSFSKKTP